MRNPIITLLILAVVAFALPGCGDKSGEAEAACSCDKGKAGETVWCEACKVGYVDSDKTSCKDCFTGKSGDAVWCESCSAGYVEGKKTECKSCVKEAQDGTKCTECEK